MVVAGELDRDPRAAVGDSVHEHQRACAGRRTARRPDAPFASDRLEALDGVHGLDPVLVAHQRVQRTAQVVLQETGGTAAAGIHESSSATGASSASRSAADAVDRCAAGDLKLGGDRARRGCLRELLHACGGGDAMAGDHLGEAAELGQVERQLRAADDAAAPPDPALEQTLARERVERRPRGQPADAGELGELPLGGDPLADGERSGLDQLAQPPLDLGVDGDPGIAIQLPVDCVADPPAASVRAPRGGLDERLEQLVVGADLGMPEDAEHEAAPRKFERLDEPSGAVANGSPRRRGRRPGGGPRRPRRSPRIEPSGCRA